MARVKQPVSINDLEFDALISETKSYEATVPEYSVEEGFSVSDAIILTPERLELTLFVTDTPVTWRQHAAPGRTERFCKQLEELYFKGEPVTVVTPNATYTMMAIESMTISKTIETGYSREIPISLKHIRTTTAKTTTIPASYGRSGKTGASAGTASTSSASSGGGSSGSGSKGSSSSSPSTSTDGKSNRKGSILYGAASSMGLL